MPLPFAREEFFAVFREHSDAAWPAQLVLSGLAPGALVAMLSARRCSGIVVSLVLAFLWAWLAVAQHFLFFSPINPLSPAERLVSGTCA